MSWALQFRKNTTPLAILFFGIGIAPLTHAKDLCASYRNQIPLPEWYNKYCTVEGHSKGSVGGSYSTFADAFNLNPASIPTAPIPYGLEYISSQASARAQNNFAIIKGFQGFGAAITSNSQNTFYGTDAFSQSTKSTSNMVSGYSPSNVSSTFNFGSAMNFFDLFSNSASSLFPTFGIMAKYSTSSKGFAPGFGLSSSWDAFTFGLSWSMNPQTSTFSRSTYKTATVGYKAAWIQTELIYSLNSQSGGYSNKAAYFGTVSLNFYNFLLTGAFRRCEDGSGLWKSQYHAALQYQLTSFLAVGYLQNYVVGLKSLGVQLLL